MWSALGAAAAGAAAAGTAAAGAGDGAGDGAGAGAAEAAAGLAAAAGLGWCPSGRHCVTRHDVKGVGAAGGEGQTLKF